MYKYCHSVFLYDAGPPHVESKFLADLHQALGKIVHKGFIVVKKKGENISGCELVFSHKDSLALFEFVYNNGTCNLFLERKYQLFKKAVETLYGVRA